MQKWTLLELLPFKALITGLVLLLCGQASAADYVILFGHHEGATGETPLAYVERDVRRMKDLFRDVMNVPDANIEILIDRSADAVESKLIQMNERLSESDGYDRLWVYYSGHGDAKGLHLGSSTLGFDKLKGLVKSSRAALRFLLVDACRSGGMTGVKGLKGFRVGQNFSVESYDANQNIRSEGMVMISASSAGEDAQESDKLSGSFFTHYWVSGARGAADANKDSRVTLEEAYRFAYAQTLKASSRTLVGTQHPTFDYDLKGKNDVLVTSLGESKGLSEGVFPDAVQVLVFNKGHRGGALAEIPAEHEIRTLALPKGQHEVQLRSNNAYYEGRVSFKSGQSHEVRFEDLERYQYAALVRKGGSTKKLSYAARVGTFYQMPVYDGDSLCIGPTLNTDIDTRFLQLSLGGRWCRTIFENRYLENQSDRLGLSLDLAYPYSWRRLTLMGGVGGRYDFLFQQLTANRATESSRTSGIIVISPFIAASYDFGQRYFVESRARLNTSLFQDINASGENAWVSSVGAGVDLSVGFRW